MRLPLRSAIPCALIIASLAAAPAASARTLSPDEALARAQAQTGATLSRANNLRLVYTNIPASRAEAPAYYVFADPADADAGFIIASADTRLRPLLGFADDGTFNPSDIPDNLRWWLSEYENEISAFLAASPAEPLPSRSGETIHQNTLQENYAIWEPVEPIVKSKWNQDAPYNSATPIVTGQHCMAGCAAVALAQVVRAIGWANPTGTVSYNDTYQNVTRTFDFSQWKPDFSKMRDTYEMENIDGQRVCTAPQDEIDEVAKLMQACGIICRTSYMVNVGTGGLSSGYLYNLGFDTSLSRAVSRGQFQSAQWETIIYNEVKSGRPMYYRGNANSGGHGFVCDGYRNNGYFHINWGWSGMSDGFFALSALDPSEQGIGSGGTGGYNAAQQIILFRKPGETAPSVSETKFVVTYSGPLDFVTFNPMSPTEYTFQFAYKLNSCSIGDEARVGLGVRLTSDDNSVDDIFIKPMEYSLLKIGESEEKVTFDFQPVLDAVPANTSWHAYPIFYIQNYDGYAIPERSDKLSEDHWDLVITEVNGQKKLDFEPAGSHTAQIEVYSLRTNDLYTSDLENRVEGIIANLSNKDYASSVAIKLSRPNPNNDGGTDVYTLATSNVFARAGEAVQLSTLYNNPNIPAGTYTLAFYSGNNILGNNTIEVKINAGNRPGASSNSHGSPSGNFQVEFWREDPTTPKADYINNNTRKANGGVLNFPLSICAYQSGDLNARLQIFQHNSLSNPLETHDIYSGQVDATDFAMIRWFQMTVESKLPLGMYSFAFFDGNGNRISTVGELQINGKVDGVIYTLNDDKTEVAVQSATDEAVNSVTIPSIVEGYSVTEIGANTFAGRNDISEIFVPKTVTYLGANAFSLMSSLKALHLASKEPPFENSMTILFCPATDLACYVPADSWEAYNNVFSSDAKLYASIGSIAIADAPKSIEAGKSASASIIVDVKERYNPNFTVTSSDPAVVQASIVGQAVTLNGRKAGTAKITVASAQSDVEPVAFTITVRGDGAPLLGDVDNNGDVDINDVVALVDIILRAGTFDTNPEGDINGNSVVDISDVVALVNIILTQTSRSAAEALEPSDAEATLSVDADGRVWLDSPVDIAGIQADIVGGTWETATALRRLNRAESSTATGIRAIAYGNMSSYIPAGRYHVATLTPGATLTAVALADPDGRPVRAVDPSLSGLTLPGASTAPVETGRYDIFGRPVSPGHRGVTIIRLSDGTTRKVVL